MNVTVNPCECGNCNWTGPESDAGPIADLHERVEPGEIMPSGECPKCGALVHRSWQSYSPYARLRDAAKHALEAFYADCNDRAFMERSGPRFEELRRQISRPVPYGVTMLRITDKAERDQLKAAIADMHSKQTAVLEPALQPPSTPSRIVIDVTGGVAEIADSEGWPDGLEIFVVDYDNDDPSETPYRLEGSPCTISKIEALDRANDTGHYAKTVAEEWGNG